MDQKTHTIYPDSQKDQYGGGVENVNFTLIIPEGRAYVPNSLRLTGNVFFLKVGSPAEPFLVSEAVYYDNRIGMHSLFRSMYVSTANGLNAVIDDYPTWVKQLMLRTNDSQKFNGSALRDLELCSPTISGTNMNVFNSAENNIMGVDFGLYPKVPLNLCDTSTGSITNRVGNITFTVTTNNNLSVLFGENAPATGATPHPNPVTGNSTYSIRNLKVHYDTKPAMPMDDVVKTKMLNVFHAKHTMNTNNDVMNINLPIVASAFVASYKPVNVINNVGVNEYQMVNPGIQRLEVTYNNNTNDVISFPLLSDEEILLNSVNALDLGNKTPSTLGMTSELYGQEYSIGLNFGEPLDMKTARVSVSTQSTKVSNTNRHFLDLFAVGAITI